MKKLSQILSLLMLIPIISCSTSLTTEGRNVRMLVKQEAPSNAQLLGDIQTSMMGEPDVMGVKNYLRNKTSQMGGNLVVIDTIEVNYNGDVKYYTGTGRAYRVK